MDTSGAKGALTGDRYRESLNDGREVWLAGERVKNVAEHPAFRGSVHEFARVLDLRLADERAREVNFYTSPETGNLVSRSYLAPATATELHAKFETTRWWMAEPLGQHGRAPDFMANVVVGLYDYRDELERNRPGFGQNAKGYYPFAREHDPVLTHALGDPQIDRSASAIDDPDLALRVVEKRADGVVIRGAKQLATLAPLSNEVLVYLNGVTAQRNAEQFVIWFALPMNTPGLKMLCREPLGGLSATGHAHHLGRRFDEQDAMLFFDVVVPSDRVFLLRDNLLALRGLGRINAWSLQSTHIRFHERVKLFVSVAAMLAHSIGVDSFRGIQEDLGELVSYAEVLRLGIAGAEAGAKPTPAGCSTGRQRRPGLLVRGRIQPHRGNRPQDWRLRPDHAAVRGRSGNRRAAALRGQVHARPRDRRGGEVPAVPDRLGAGGDGFGSRQELYEYLHRGDPGAGRTRLLRSYDRSEVDERVRKLISAPLA
jgi:aromatic ring hydroxylase